MSNESYITGFSVALMVTAIANGILVLLKENIPAIHDILVTLTGHHWISHGLILLILFIVLGLIFSSLNKEGQMWISFNKQTQGAVVSLIIGAGLIFMFNLYNYIK